jgi:hypothetical protein
VGCDQVAEVAFLAPFAGKLPHLASSAVLLQLGSGEGDVAPLALQLLKGALSHVLFEGVSRREDSTAEVGAGLRSLGTLLTTMMSNDSHQKRAVTVLTLLSFERTALNVFLHRLAQHNSCATLQRTGHGFFGAEFEVRVEVGDRHWLAAVMAFDPQHREDGLVGTGSLDKLELCWVEGGVRLEHLKMQVSGCFCHQPSRQGGQTALSQPWQAQWGRGSRVRQTGQTTDCRAPAVLWSSISTSS